MLLALCALLCAAAAGAAEPYRLGSGDVVEVEVWREPDLSGRYTVDAAGMLPHMLAGPVPARGATLAELTQRLREALERDYLREARVAVALVESARAKASVLGAVAKPGFVPLRDDARLLDAIFAAGGTTEAAGESATVLRVAPDGRRDEQGRPLRLKRSLDLAGLLRGDLSQNVRLRPGDVVVVATRETDVASAPPQTGRVRVVGEVERPGSYPLDEAPTVLDALLAAGGLTDYAAAGRARLVRGEGEARREERLRLDDVMEGRSGATNLELRDGDILVVPESFF